MRSFIINQTDGYLGNAPKSKLREYMIIEDRVHKIHRVVVHEFTMGDVDDPILYASQPLLDWQNSEQGQWVMSNAMETPEWHRYEDMHSWGHKFYITAKLKDKDYSFYLLKWGK